MNENLETNTSKIFDDRLEKTLCFVVLFVALLACISIIVGEIVGNNKETVRMLYFPSPNSESVLICKQYEDNPIAECDVSKFDGVLNN